MRNLKRQYDTAQADMLWYYVSPLLIVLGNYGNILSIVTLMLQRSLKKLPASYFLMALALSHIAILDTGLMRQWILRLPGHLDIRTMSDLGCGLHLIFTYFSLQFGAWMLVGLSLERFMSILHYDKWKWSQKQAMGYILVTLALLLGLNLHFLWSYQLKSQDESDLKLCIVTKPAYIQWALSEFRTIHMVLAYIAPLVFTLLFLGLIGLIIWRKKNHFNTSKGPTWTVYVLIILFILTSTPLALYMVLNGLWYNMNETHQDNLGYAIVSLIQYTYSGWIIFIYLTWDIFRWELKFMLCGCCPSVEKDLRSMEDHVSTNTTESTNLDDNKSSSTLQVPNVTSSNRSSQSSN